MRIVIRLEPKEGKLFLPVHYNHLVQSMIYASLEVALARWFHEEGFLYRKRKFKLFTFSRVLARKTEFLKEERKLLFHPPIYLKIASVETKLLESLATHLVKEPLVRLGSTECVLKSVEVEMPVKAKGPVLVRTLSPITIHSTLETPKGKKKTYFYQPFEEEFSEQIMANLRRKAAAYLGNEPPPLNGGYIKPVRVSKKNEAIVNFKGFWIKGWTGVYELNLPAFYFNLAYDAGLGARNSQGFGMVEVVE